MCGRLSQYRGIHDFVAALSIPDAMINHVGDEPLARYNIFRITGPPWTVELIGRGLSQPDGAVAELERRTLAPQA